MKKSFIMVILCFSFMNTSRAGMLSSVGDFFLKADGKTSSEEATLLKTENERFMKENQMLKQEKKNLEDYFEKNKECLQDSTVQKCKETAIIQNSYFQKIKYLEKYLDEITKTGSENILIFEPFEQEKTSDIINIDTCGIDDDERPKALYKLSSSGIEKVEFIGITKKNYSMCGEEATRELWKFKSKASSITDFVLINTDKASYKIINNKFQKVTLRPEQVQEFNLFFYGDDQVSAESKTNDFKKSGYKDCETSGYEDLVYLKCGEMDGFLIKDNEVLAMGNLKIMGELIINKRKYYHVILFGEKGNISYYVPEAGNSIHIKNNCNDGISC